MMLAELTGRIERIVYTSKENGFTIARLKVSGHRDLVTVTGNLMAPSPGETLKMRGEWTNHPKYGDQFRVEEYKTVVPATVDGIRKYLGSGLIKGLGPVMAGRIVERFGKNSLDVIENDMEKLAEVEGIGKKRIAMIREAWAEQREIRDVMLFLQSHGVGPGYATRIFKHYGNRSIAVVKENPYRLATDIFGVGFLTADSIADKLGFAKDSRLRIEAGILWLLHQLTDEGHVYYPYTLLAEKTREILGVDGAAVVNAIGILSLEGTVIVEDLNESTDEIGENNKAVYLETLYTCETRIAVLLKAIADARRPARVKQPERAVAWVQQRLSIRLAEKQVEALKRAISENVMVITGGPGTGKTTIINALLKILSRVEAKTLLAAPTGRAAKRMFETSGHEAKTIHRLLEFSFQKGGFQRNEKKPLECDVLIVDEASMIDTRLMHHLLKAVSRETTLILVGDVDQLPSVGAGNVLKDIIASNTVSVVKLNEVFRQARESRIIVNAHNIIQGTMPFFDSDDTDSDFYFIQQEDPEKVLDIILELIRKRIPRRFGLDPVNDIQVLTPMHKGIVGAGNLNKRLQESLNPGRFGITRGDREYRISDKVMQIKNNYDRDIFNGDIGRIAEIRPEDQEVIISFDGRNVVYDFSDLDEVVPAYAISVHKSQGSEYPAVVIPILTQHFILLQRNLIYTAVTRGKKLVVMVGTRKALAIGVNNDKTEKRYTNLAQRLRR